MASVNHGDNCQCDACVWPETITSSAAGLGPEKYEGWTFGDLLAEMQRVASSLPSAEVMAERRESILDHLYSIRTRLLDKEDDCGLDARSAARLHDVESEIAAIREAQAARVREDDPGWARLEELERKLRLKH